MQGSYLHSNKKLSIIVAAHNLEDLIGKCLESVKKCLYKVSSDDYEVLLIDDSSFDSTPSILKKFSEENESFIYIRKEFRNLGKVKKYAVEISSGEYITFVDGDDFLSDFSMREILDFLEYRQPDIFISKLNEVRKDADIIERSRLSSPIKLHRNTAIKEFLIHKKFQAHSIGKFFRKELFCGSNFPEVPCYEDALSFPSFLVKCNSIYYTNMKYYNYIKREGSLSNSINDVKVNIMAEVILIMDKTFGKNFRNLTACHAIELIYKYEDKLSKKYSDSIYQIVKNLSILGFMLDSNIRFRFKRKFMKIRKNMISTNG
ncbi:glycosyltransferase family 2 protein [Photorhabdus laumondii]|uniref:glycosyltransferase family 2 protein n=1 Tax=Photorhabdus laumondii TaxID=2218628 RepID=UPI001E3BAE2F|nr:glycosyltransferase family 2 protein [Photorhabdus laumondii]